MSTELEELLRSGMERFTQDIRVPSGLALKAERHRQKRRMTARVVAATGTAVTAGALAVAGVTGALGSAGGHPVQATQIQTDAYVITRIEHALAAPSQNLLEHSRTVYSPGTVLVPMPWGLRVERGSGSSSRFSVGSSVRWSYHDGFRLSAFAPTGQHAFDEAITIPAGGGELTTVTVSYRDATWWRATSAGAVTGKAPAGCGPGLHIDGSDWAGTIRHYLDCGEFRVTGRQQVDGIDAIKIAGARGFATLWVNPETYLPVRIVITPARGWSQTDFQWLAPTAANLAQLHVTVPAGFTQVPPPSS
jgi:hypothetical protein